MQTKGGGGNSRFSVEKLLSQYRNISSGNPSWFQKNSGIEAFHAYEGGGGGAVSRFSVVMIKLKNVGKGWDSNLYLQLQNPFVLPTVPWEPLEL